MSINVITQAIRYLFIASAFMSALLVALFLRKLGPSALASPGIPLCVSGVLSIVALRRLGRTSMPLSSGPVSPWFLGGAAGVLVLALVAFALVAFWRLGHG